MQDGSPTRTIQETKQIYSMEWLAVKMKGVDYYFTQSREERTIAIREMIKQGRMIETIVIKTFENRISAQTYCLKINLVNDLLNEMFP
jgi:hypothetical protein